jgi:zinc and cadmium transporter
MTPLAWVAVYSLAVLLFSLAGGSVPLLKRVTHDRLQLYLSLSAGVMLGAACFHVMPDAVESLGAEVFGWWVAGGVVGLFCIERFLAPHTHEPSIAPPAAKDDHGHEHGHDHEHHHHHHHEHGNGHAPVSPPVAGWAAVLGLTLHTFMNGVALAGAVKFDFDNPGQHSGAAWGLPGLALFLAIVLHKPADALSISTVLRRRGVSTGTIGLVQLGFALMVPVGGVAFLLTEGALAKGLENQITGAALAFSAGTFLFIALSDLLPEVHFHRHDRVPLFGALLAGVVLMGLIALLEPHEEKEKEGKSGPEATSAAAETAH